MDKILVSGCSNTEGATWPAELFPNCAITNVAKAGAGNRYISDSIIYNINLTDKPDFVFILFSGINRSDLIVPSTKTTKKYAEQYKYYGIIGDSLYLFTGGDKYNKSITNSYNNIKDPTWPEINGCEDFINLPIEIKQECTKLFGLINFNTQDINQSVHQALMLNYFTNPTFLQTQTYRSLINCQNFLKLHQIPYLFSFPIDPFDVEFSSHMGRLDKTHPLYFQVDWTKFINKTLGQTGIELNLIENDGQHVHPKGHKAWAKTIINQVNRERRNNNAKSIFKFFNRGL